MNAKTTSAGDLEKALAALQATQAVAAKMGEAGKIAGKAGGLPGLRDVPFVSMGLKVTGGLLQLDAGQETREYGYKLLGKLIPLLDKKIEEKKHQPEDCMLALKSCKQ